MPMTIQQPIRVPWNAASTLGLVGFMIAYALVFAIVGPHGANLTVLLGAVAGLLAIYATSTALGAWTAGARAGRRLDSSLMAGIGVAIGTLLAAAVASGIAYFLMMLAQDVSSAYPGQDILGAVAQFAPMNAREHLAGIVALVLSFGLAPAVVLGLGYAAILRRAFARSRLAEPPTTRPLATAAQLLLLAALTVAALFAGLRFGQLLLTLLLTWR